MLQLRRVLTPAEVHYNVGSVYESTGRREQAKAEYRRPWQLDPALADARSRLEELQGGARCEIRRADGVVEETE